MTPSNCPSAPIKSIYLVKKGMAKKAFIKYMQTGNIESIRKQIQKGTVKIL